MPIETEPGVCMWSDFVALLHVSHEQLMTNACRSHGSVCFSQYLNFKSVLYFFAVPVNHCFTMACTEVAIRTYLFAKARRDFMHKSGIHLSHTWMHTTCIYIFTLASYVHACVPLHAYILVRAHTYVHIHTRTYDNLQQDVCVMCVCAHMLHAHM
jgi:hypothetical protein